MHLPARIRRKPAFDGGQHGFVEVTEPVGELAGVDEEATDGLERLRLEVGRRQPPRQCERIAGEGGRAVEVAAPVRDLGLPQDEAPELDRLGLRVESAAAAPQPRAGHSRPGLHHMVLIEPHRAPTRLHVLAQRHVAHVGLLAGLDAVVEVSQPPRRLRDDVEPIGFGPSVEHADRPGELQCLGPVPATERGPRVLDPLGTAFGSVLRQVGHCTTPRSDAGQTVQGRPDALSRTRAAWPGGRGPAGSPRSG